jgi:hypothetical protein
VQSDGLRRDDALALHRRRRHTACGTGAEKEIAVIETASWFAIGLVLATLLLTYPRKESADRRAPRPEGRPSERAHRA